MAEASMTGRYRIPFHVRPMLATLVAEAFDKPGWVFEEKYDAFPKTSGSRGLHVFVPIRVGPDADEVLAFAEWFVARVASAHPNTLTVEHSRAARCGRVYLDPFRNAFGQTVVAPYCVRRCARAPISTPLDWTEVTPELGPADFNFGNCAPRFSGSDP
jgi:bifunctional non-homologous end joining protein LigD